LAVAVRLAFAGNMGLFYASTFRSAGARAERHRFVLISAAAYFINLISKSSGFGGLALYLNEGARNGDAPMKTTAAYMAAYVLSYVAYICILISALALLYARGSLTATESAAAGVVLLIVLCGGSLIYAGLRSEAALSRLLQGAVAPINGVGLCLLHRRLIDQKSSTATRTTSLLRSTLCWVGGACSHFLLLTPWALSS
jgi:hypothetical protein